MKAGFVLFALLVACGAAAAQQVRGLPQDRAKALKPDLTEGGGNSSVGASRPTLPEEKKDRFDVLDLDGDGRISLAEAAGHAEVVVHFDRADRNRDGKLSRAEFDSIYHPKPLAKAKGKGKKKASASAGASRQKSR